MRAIFASIDSFVSLLQLVQQCSSQFYQEAFGAVESFQLSEIGPMQRRAFDSKVNQEERGKGDEPFKNQSDSKATLKDQKNCQIDLLVNLLIHFLVLDLSPSNFKCKESFLTQLAFCRNHTSMLLFSMFFVDSGLETKSDKLL